MCETQMTHFPPEGINKVGLNCQISREQKVKQTLAQRATSRPGAHIGPIILLELIWPPKNKLDLSSLISFF